MPTNPALQNLDFITERIIAAAIRLHRDPGPGLLESVYEALLAHLLIMEGFTVTRQLAVPIEYNGIKFDEGFRIDLLVQERVIVEIKSIQRIASVHQKQLLTHLRLMKLPVGLLMNFGQDTLKDGLKRIVNNLNPTNSPRLRVNNRPQPTG